MEQNRDVKEKDQDKLEKLWNELLYAKPDLDNDAVLSELLFIRMLTKKYIKITLTKLEKSNKLDKDIRKIVIDGFNELMREINTYGTIETN